MNSFKVYCKGKEMVHTSELPWFAYHWQNSIASFYLFSIRKNEHLFFLFDLDKCLLSRYYISIRLRN